MAARTETGDLIGKLQPQIAPDAGRRPLPFGLRGEGLAEMLRPSQRHSNGANEALKEEKAYQGCPSAADRMDL